MYLLHLLLVIVNCQGLVMQNRGHGTLSLLVVGASPPQQKFQIFNAHFYFFLISFNRAFFVISLVFAFSFLEQIDL